MKLVRVDPPGSWCQYEAIREMLPADDGKTFLEIGCGSGMLSLRLLELGWRGVGIDFSQGAFEHANTNLAKFIADGRYRLIASDIFDIDIPDERFDVGLSIMVMEHIENDVAFLRRITAFVKPGGFVIIGVPGRYDRWGVEDETVGHLRRYERADLRKTLLSAGLTAVSVWSIGVPVANILFHLSNFFIRESSEVDKMAQSSKAQTQTSGIREIPGKTFFPSWCKLILNRFTLYPFFVVQRFFYQTNLGLTMIARGKVAANRT